MNVQERVAQYVQDNGIKQSFIAEKTGFSKVKISMLLNLNQKMTADEFEIFCKALRKQPNDFMLVDED